ncbi:hypothetical protein U8P76_28600 (plasmid) [Rhizobium johnstonii]|nr:hypothetical protein U8P76_28600 [Rhizobium johnstonii]
MKDLPAPEFSTRGAAIRRGKFWRRLVAGDGRDAASPMSMTVDRKESRSGSPLSGSWMPAVPPVLVVCRPQKGGSASMEPSCSPSIMISSASGDFELGFDLATLGGLDASVQLGAQFFDLLFDHRHLLDV